MGKKPSEKSKRARWKRVEGEVAKYIGGTRIPVTGRRGADIRHAKLYVDVKSRKQVPKKLLYMLETVESEQCIYVRLNYDNTTYLMWRLKNYDHPLTHVCDVPGPIKWPKIGFQWLQHMQETCPEGRLACMVLHVPGMWVKNSIILMREVDVIKWKC